jgi:hypothetical protein
MINLFKVKEKNKENAATANGKPAAKKQSPGELRLHKGLSSWIQFLKLSCLVHIGHTAHLPVIWLFTANSHVFQILLNLTFPRPPTFLFQMARMI